jgi:DNA-binding NtrC family response regulator
MAKILVVDDEVEACNVLEEFLGSKGHEVHTALDGPSALDKFKEVKPQLVFLDMIMPGMGGLDVLKEMKEIDPSVTVIMVTVVTDHEQAKETIESGAYDYITKPVDLNYLENVMMVRLME